MQFFQHVLAVHNLAKNCVLSIEPGTGYEGDEELRAICIRSCISHGEKSGNIMLDLEVFIRESPSVDGLATGAIVVCEVSSLCHEVVDDTMEMWLFEAEALLVGAKSSEVGGSLGGLFVEELKDKFADLFLPEVDFEEDVFKCHKKYLIISIKISENNSQRKSGFLLVAFHLEKQAVIIFSSRNKYSFYLGKWKDIILFRRMSIQGGGTITIESHSKQVKLLNDYIVSLEKKISESKDNDVHRLTRMSEENNKLTEENVRIRNEISSLKFMVLKTE